MIKLFVALMLQLFPMIVEICNKHELGLTG